jgi:hypothetical protein
LISIAENDLGVEKRRMIIRLKPGYARTRRSANTTASGVALDTLIGKWLDFA